MAESAEPLCLSLLSAAVVRVTDNLSTAVEDLAPRISSLEVITLWEQKLWVQVQASKGLRGAERKSEEVIGIERRGGH